MLTRGCRESGFTMVQHVGGEYHAMYQLDAAGVAMAIAKLQELHEHGIVNNLMWTVTGYVSGPAMFDGMSDSPG